MRTTKLEEIGEVRALLKMDQISFSELLGVDVRTAIKAEKDQLAKLSSRVQAKLDRLMRVIERLGGIMLPENIPLWLAQAHPGFNPDLSRAELLDDTESFDALLLVLP